jgi:hypothetical protein
MEEEVTSLQRPGAPAPLFSKVRRAAVLLRRHTTHFDVTAVHGEEMKAGQSGVIPFFRYQDRQGCAR